jgi:hypothetical protein
MCATIARHTDAKGQKCLFMLHLTLLVLKMDGIVIFGMKLKMSVK